MFFLAILAFVVALAPLASSKNYHNATEVMVNVNGTDRDLQYVLDNDFFNSDLRDRRGLVFSSPSSIHHGKHQVVEILVSSGGRTGTLLDYLKNKTLPAGFSRDNSVPTHPATAVLFSSGKSLQELVDAGDFSCTVRRYCEGNYLAIKNADCSTSRHSCSRGCSGGRCIPAPRPPPTPPPPIPNTNVTNETNVTPTPTPKVKWSPGSPCHCTASLTDSANAGTTTRDCLPPGSDSCTDSGSGWGKAFWDNAQYLDGARVWRQRKDCSLTGNACPVRRKTVTACTSNNLYYRTWRNEQHVARGGVGSTLTHSYRISSDITSGRVNLHVKGGACHGSITALGYRIRGGTKTLLGGNSYTHISGLCNQDWVSLRNIAVRGGDTIRFEMKRTGCGWFNQCGHMDMLVFKVQGCVNS